MLLLPTFVVLGNLKLLCSIVWKSVRLSKQYTVAENDFPVLNAIIESCHLCWKQTAFVQICVKFLF
jgi:hypothetical protein